MVLCNLSLVRPACDFANIYCATPLGQISKTSKFILARDGEIQILKLNIVVSPAPRASDQGIGPARGETRGKCCFGRLDDTVKSQQVHGASATPARDGEKQAAILRVQFRRAQEQRCREPAPPPGASSSTSRRSAVGCFCWGGAQSGSIMELASPCISSPFRPEGRVSIISGTILP
ncbi:hypothetical protein VUR80DRAFT_5447 [Thermomyces stellatus]